MDDIGKIVYETVRISAPEFIRLAFAGMAGGLLGAYINDRLTRKRDKETGITSEKLVLMPMIDELIVTTKNCGHLLGEARAMIWPKLHISVSRFAERLKHRTKNLNSFNAAWEILRGTTREECPTQQPNTSDEVYAKQKELLISRLEALRKIVHES
jgi:hypothetical protein